MGVQACGEPEHSKRISARQSSVLPELTALLHRAYKPLADQGLRYLATHQSDEVTSKWVTLGECFVATRDSGIRGTILFKRAEQIRGCQWNDRDDVACLGQVAVDPDLQAQGIGARLISVVEKRTVASGAGELALDTAEPTTHLVSWYGRMGFRFIEHAQWGHTTI